MRDKIEITCNNGVYVITRAHVIVDGVGLVHSAVVRRRIKVYADHGEGANAAAERNHQDTTLNNVCDLYGIKFGEECTFEKNGNTSSMSAFMGPIRRNILKVGLRSNASTIGTMCIRMNNHIMVVKQTSNFA